MPASFCPRDWTTLTKCFWNVCIAKSNPVTDEGKIIASNVKGRTQLLKANVTLHSVYGTGHLSWCKKILRFDGVTFYFLAREVTLPKTKICNVSQWIVLTQNIIQRAGGTQECCRVSHTMKKGKELSKEAVGTVKLQRRHCAEVQSSPTRDLSIWTKTVPGWVSKFSHFCDSMRKLFESEMLQDTAYESDVNKDILTCLLQELFRELFKLSYHHFSLSLCKSKQLGSKWLTWFQVNIKR